MKTEMKISLPTYKIIYSLLFVIILPLIRGINDVTEIGIALDLYIALLVIIFCADTLEQEKRENRWEIINRFPVRIRIRSVRQRLLIQWIYILLVTGIGYLVFYWQNPGNLTGQPHWWTAFTFLWAIVPTILFWSLLSMTIVNITGWFWGGIGVSGVIWLIMSSGQIALKLPLGLQVFAYGFRSLENTADVSWLWGKAAAMIFSIAALLLMPGMRQRSSRHQSLNIRQRNRGRHRMKLH